MSCSYCTGTMAGTQQGPHLCTPTLLTPTLTVFPLLPFPLTCGILLPGVSSVMSAFSCVVCFLHQIYTCPASKQTPQATLCLRPPVFPLSGIYLGVKSLIGRCLPCPTDFLFFPPYPTAVASFSLIPSRTDLCLVSSCTTVRAFVFAKCATSHS